MTSVNIDRDVTWNTKYAQRKINGHLYKKAHSGLFPNEIGADTTVEYWKGRGYRARKELVFLHEKGDKKVGIHWVTPGKAMWLVWRSVVKISGRK